MNSRQIFSSIRIARHTEILRLIASSYREGYFDNKEAFLIHSTDSLHTIRDYFTVESIIYNSDLSDIDTIEYINTPKNIIVSKPEQVLELIKNRIHNHFDISYDEKKWNQFLNVNKSSTINESLALLSKENDKKEISNYNSVLDYLVENDVYGSYNFLTRQAAFRGRPIMPFSKMKYPLSRSKVLETSPEFNIRLDMEVFAAHKDIVYHRTSQAYDGIISLFKNLFPLEYDEFKRFLIGKSLNPEDYVPYLIHPTSIELIHKILKPNSNGENLIETPIKIESYPTLSYRTVLTKQNCQIKLPVPFQCTGDIRHIDIELIENGCLISDLINEIFLSEHNFDNTFFLEKDLGTFAIDNNKVEGLTALETRYFAYVIRDCPFQNIDTNKELYINLASLFAFSPKSGKPLIVAICNDYCASNKSTIEDFFSHYCKGVLKPILNLFLKYGVMPEAHQQNLSIVFNKNNWQIEKLSYHDLAYSVSIYKPIFNELGAKFKSNTKKLPFAYNSPEPSVRQFVHTTIWLNIMPMIQIFSKQYSIKAELLMDLFVNAFISISDEIKSEVFSSKNFDQQETFLKLWNHLERSVLINEGMECRQLLGKLFRICYKTKWGEIPNHKLGTIRNTKAIVENKIALNFNAKIKLPVDHGTY